MPDVVTEQPFQRYHLSSKAWLLEAARKRPRRPSERFGGQKGVGGPAGGFGFPVAVVCGRSGGMLLGGAGVLLMSSVAVRENRCK